MVTLNEVKLAEDILQSGKVSKKLTSTLFLLAKYYRQHEKYNTKKTYEAIDSFMTKNLKEYDSASYKDLLDDIIKKATKYPMREIDYVPITRNELDKIHELDNIKLEKIMFVILCYAKMFNLSSKSNNDWSNISIKDLFKQARVVVKHKDDKFRLLHELYIRNDYIELSNCNDNLNLKCAIVDKENSEVILKIDDFRELGYQYEQYIGDGKFTHCQECGVLIRKKNPKDHSTKYCIDCLKIIKSKHNMMYYSTHKNSVKAKTSVAQ